MLRRGHGFGIRSCHYSELLERRVKADFAEAITENFLGRGGRARRVLERVRGEMPVVLHGVSLSLGSVDPIDSALVRGIARLADELQVAWVSDHLCFGSIGGHFGHDLWPLPFTEEAIVHVAERISRVQDVLGRKLLVENVSSYVEYRESELTEWAFVSEICRRADCELLLDVNNVVVNAKNHGFSADEYVASLPRDRIRQLHLAGHSDYGDHAIDDHGSAVPEDVLRLYRRVHALVGPLPALIEWDENVPSLECLENEIRRVASVETEVSDGTRAA